LITVFHVAPEILELLTFQVIKLVVETSSDHDTWTCPRKILDSSRTRNDLGDRDSRM